MPIKTHKERIAELEKQNQSHEFEIDELKKDMANHINEFKADKEKVLKFVWSMLKWSAAALFAGVVWIATLVLKKVGIT